MAKLDAIIPTTELEAVNAVLSAAGIAEIDQDELDTPTLDDTKNAVSILRRAIREIQARGWKFNYRVGLQLNPVGTYNWTDSDGKMTTLNVFKKHPSALTFSLTACHENSGLDMVEAVSFRYLVGGVSQLILIDRIRNWDGAEASRYPHVYIDGAFGCDFDKCPETFRAYAVAVASRRFVKTTLGEDASRALSEDEALTGTMLMREQGLRVVVNMFDTPEAQDMLGRRPTFIGSAVRRVFPQ